MDTLSRLENAEFKEAFDEFDKVLDLLEVVLSCTFSRMVVGQYRVMSY